MTLYCGDVITFCEVNFNDGVRDVHYNQLHIEAWEFSIFILSEDKNFLNPGFPYLVCKKFCISGYFLLIFVDSSDFE